MMALQSLARLSLWGAAVLLLIICTPAYAEFGDCNDSDYRAEFDPRIESIPYDCWERLRLPVDTADGTREIRLVHHRFADWAIAPGVIDEIKQGIRGAVEALGQLGSFHMKNVTVLLIDGLPPRETGTEEFSNIVALTHSIQIADPERNSTLEVDECGIGVYLVSRGATREHAAYVVAHELFHCVELATLTSAQMTSGSGGSGAGGDWWLEGAADWFAALANPEPGPLPDRIAAFDAASADTPLYEMAYEAVVFFLWLGADQGPTAIIPFLEGMADSRSPAAQRAAMQAALPAESWLRFAQAYLDGDITHPHGTALSFSPTEGDDWTWSETRTEQIRLEPFVIRRGWLNFECGRWAPTGSPAEPYSVRLQSETWADLPEQIDTEAGDAERYRFAGFNATNGRTRLEVEARLLASCAPCAGTRAIDSCLVGAWRQTGGGAVEWLRRNMPSGFDIPMAEQSGRTFILKADGTYQTGQVVTTMTMIVRDEDGDVRGDGNAAAQSTGRWSVAGGRLNICADAQSFSGHMRMTAPDGSSDNLQIPQPRAAGTVHFSYSCSDTAMETRKQVRGVSDPISTQYARMAPPEEPPAE